MTNAAAIYPVHQQYPGGISHFRPKTPLSASSPTRTFLKVVDYVRLLSNCAVTPAALSTPGGFSIPLYLRERGRHVMSGVSEVGTSMAALPTRRFFKSVHFWPGFVQFCAGPCRPFRAGLSFSSSPRLKPFVRVYPESRDFGMKGSGSARTRRRRLRRGLGNAQRDRLGCFFLLTPSLKPLASITSLHPSFKSSLRPIPRHPRH